MRAPALTELAHRCGIDADGLERTVKCFNGFCIDGRDPEFGRGDDPYDRYYGDPRLRPNPSLGPINTAPFYAVALYAGDIGTNGGLLTVDYGHVLREGACVWR